MLVSQLNFFKTLSTQSFVLYHEEAPNSRYIDTRKGQ